LACQLLDLIAARLALILLYRFTFTLMLPAPHDGEAQFHSPAVIATPAPNINPEASAPPSG